MAGSAAGIADVAGDHYLSIRVFAHAAATATEKLPLFYFPIAAAIHDIDYIPEAAITGTDTNSTHLNIDLDTTEIANIDFTDTADNDGVALTAQDFNGTTFPQAVTAGELLVLEYEKVGNGLDIPDGLIYVRFSWK